MAGEITSTAKLVGELERSSGRIAKYKRQAAQAARRTAVGGAGLGSAALLGVVRAFGYRSLPGTEIDTGLVLGGLALVVGVSDLADDYSDVAVGAGIGLAAPGLSDIVETAVKKARA